ncbi:intraflagellar transport protein 46 homolog isoform X2 [Phymastichus coffea]|uniref:intraflagellar transport protein 46 homolog isoform X2 n=1 Tax=Phymastichus coffea TaxID=108790 RepID=UPI00273A85C9|nr:intraflagellar transport protein 46 homolog isoform X2 [Phymastichus coffea]
MDAHDSSEEEERAREDIAAFTKFDESIEVRNAEDVRSPMNDARSPCAAAAAAVTGTLPTNDFRRYSMPEESMGMDSETSASEDSEEIDTQKIMRMKLADFYDASQFEDLDVSAEVKELFQNITRYTPQKIDLHYKLAPFTLDYIPAVGDIDAFLKIPRPDGLTEKAGLTVLDEPAAEQSEPAVLQLQLRSKTRSASNIQKPSVVKRLEDASKHGRMIDKWIEDMGQLHRSKPPPAVQLTRKFPDLDTLLQPWAPEVEDKLYLSSTADFEKLDCSLFQMIDLICALLDIPVYGDERIESLHTLFALYAEVHNVDIQRIHNS